MSTSVIGNKQFFQPSHNWETRDVITQDDVISAYLKGKADGKSEQQKVNLRLFKENLEKAQQVSEELFKQVAGIGFKILGLHLKADSILSFDALLIVDKNDYVSEEFLKSFSIARTLKNEADDETFNIYFTFTPRSSSLNENCFIHDGFFAEYAKA